MSKPKNMEEVKRKIKYISDRLGKIGASGEIFAHSITRYIIIDTAYDILINNPKITLEEYITEMDKKLG